MKNQKKFVIESEVNDPLKPILQHLLSLETSSLIDDYTSNIKKIVIIKGNQPILDDRKVLSINSLNLEKIAASKVLTANEFNSLIVSRFCDGLAQHLSSHESPYVVGTGDSIRIRLADYKSIVERSLLGIDLSTLFETVGGELQYENIDRIKKKITMSKSLGQPTLDDRGNAIDSICKALSEKDEKPRLSDIELFNNFNKDILNTIESVLNEGKQMEPLFMMTVPDYDKQVLDPHQNTVLSEITSQISQRWDDEINKVKDKQTLTEKYNAAVKKLESMTLFKDAKQVTDILSYDKNYRYLQTLERKTEKKIDLYDISIYREIGLVSRQSYSTKKLKLKKRRTPKDHRKSELEKFRIRLTMDTPLLRKMDNLKQSKLIKNPTVPGLIALSYWHLHFYHPNFYKSLKNIEKENTNHTKQNLVVYHRQLLELHNFIVEELLEHVVDSFIEGSKDNMTELEERIKIEIKKHEDLWRQAYSIPDEKVGNKKMLAGKQEKQVVDKLKEELKNYYWLESSENIENAFRNTATTIIKYHFNYDFLLSVIGTYYHSFIGHEKLYDLYDNEDKTI